VDIFAPGVNTLSTGNSSDTATLTESGTSMSTPHVTGAAALYLAANPSATPAQVASALTTNATSGVVKSPGSGSPNRLLYTAFIGAGGGGGNQAPAANFTSSCSSLTCSFTDTSTDADGTIASRSWNFGDGTTSTAANPSKTYAAAGTYTVTLTVTDNAGATGTTSKSVTVGSGGDPDPGTPTLTSGVSKSGTSAASGGFVYYKIAVPAGASKLTIALTGPSCGLLGCSPDLDLFARRAAKPTTTAKDASAETGSSTETVTISNPAADWYYIGVYTYSGSSGKAFSVKATVS
jgi:serine protease